MHGRTFFERPTDHPARVSAEATAAATQTPQLHGIELRLASFVHGHAGSVFLPILVNSARQTGRSLYIGEGRNRLSSVHVEAAAEAYLSAMANRQAGEIYLVAADDAPTMRDLAEAIAIGTGTKAVSVTAAEAAAVLDPFTAMFMEMDNGLSSRKARCKLGWSPAGWPTLLGDVAHGSYTASPAGPR